MKKHLIWMIIGCIVPLLLIFLAPALGLNDNVPLFFFIIAMFACHLLMPMHHGEHKKKENQNSSQGEEKSEHHHQSYPNEKEI